MRSLDEISLMQEQKSETLKSTNSMINIEDEQIEIAEKTICELRDLLTFIKSYKQIIDVKHPETKAFEHWDDLNADMDAMAMRLMAYEKQIHTMRKNEVA